MFDLHARAASEPKGRPLRGRTVATASPAALLVAPLPAAPAAADLSRGIDLACPHPTSDAFTDDKANVHESAIKSMARWKVNNGTPANNYPPESAIRRDQTAVLCSTTEA
jgi:hypothetical protein